MDKQMDRYIHRQVGMEYMENILIKIAMQIGTQIQIYKSLILRQIDTRQTDIDLNIEKQIDRLEGKQLHRKKHRQRDKPKT